MPPKTHFWTGLFAAAACGALLANCSNPYGSSGSGGFAPSPSPSPTVTPSPGPCGTMVPNNPNLILVAMAGGIAGTKPAGYPSIFGYGVSDTNLDVPAQSALINVTSDGGSTPITTQNVIQFFNGESFGSPTLHSAYGFGTSAFPNHYTFPSPAPSPTATTLSPTRTWFTGFVATEDQNGNPCFSPGFQLTAGTYYFGDYSAYNTNSVRGILIVVTPAPSSARTNRLLSRARKRPSRFGSRP